MKEAATSLFCRYAGDEIAFRFRAPVDLPSGWKHDFVWAGDGWAKDGDLNTRFSKALRKAVQELALIQF